MKLNVSKTKFMLLGTPTKTSKVSHVQVCRDIMEDENVCNLLLISWCSYIDVNLRRLSESLMLIGSAMFGAIGLPYFWNTER